MLQASKHPDCQGRLIYYLSNRMLDLLTHPQQMPTPNLYAPVVARIQLILISRITSLYAAILYFCAQYPQSISPIE